jgi:hypothetical protein
MMVSEYMSAEQQQHKAFTYLHASPTMNDKWKEKEN